MTVYVTTEGDMVDDIAHRNLGDAALCVAIYVANPGLAARGLVLPAGTTILLPDAPAPVQRKTVRLWGTAK